MSRWSKKKHEWTVMVFFAFLFLCWSGLAYSFFRVGLGIAREVPKLGQGETFPTSLIDVFIEIFLKLLIFLWVLLHLQGIVLTIHRKDPFNSRNPGRIRKIAWGAFAYAVLNVISDLYWTRAEHFGVHSLLSHLRGDTGRMILIGAGILIIAKAFTMGLKLQEDQSLTI